MSYPGFENHGAYYDNSSNEPNTRDAYHPGQSSRSSAAVLANAAVHPVSSRQSSYDGAIYNSPSQDQQNYGAESRDTLSYAKSMWSGINGQDSQQLAHDFRRQQNSLDNQSTYSGAGQDFYSSNTQSATQQSTQGLDNLAYVSGIEPAVLHGRGRGAIIGGAGPTDFSAHRNTGVFQARVLSPAQTTSQTYFNQRPASTYSTHGYDGSGSPHQGLTASLAAALAGAVSRRQSNQRPPSTTHAQPSPLSPNMGNAPSRDEYNTQPSHRAALPYSLSAINASRGTQQSARHSPAPSLLHTNLQTQRYPNTSRLDPAESRPMTQPEGQDLLRNKGKPSSRGRSQTTNNPVQSNDRIGTLATNSSPRDSLLPTLQQQATPSEAMPSFVDQNQVFNSYRKDYGRREREAAETEGETGREAAGTPSEEPTQNSEAWTQIVVPNDSIAPRPVTSSPSAPGKPQKPGEREEKRTGSVPPVTTSPRTSTPSQTVSGVDPGMASEMKAMIERMREWKKKDPLMFSKLWEEMKRGSAVTSARIGPTRAPSTQATQAIQATQATQAETPQSPSTDTAAAASASKVADTRKIPSPRLAAQLNGFNVVVENNEERLPDLGRFPAERRSPPKYAKSDANDSIKRDEVSSAAPTESPPVQPVTSRSQPVPWRLPARTSSSDTIWPEEKRMALAEAAVTALNTDPTNRDKGITVQTIHDMLDQNPSYIDLCKILEDRGLRFHRGQFARQLLANVPDLATPQPKAGSEQPQNPVRVDTGRFPTRPALPQNIAMSSKQGVRPSYMNGPHPGSVKIEMSPYRAMPTSQFLSQTPKSYAQRSFSTTKPVGTPMPQATKASLGVPSPNVPPPVPGSKAAMSRKRDFSELVDLTQLSDDEDYVMPSKRLHFEEPSPSPSVFSVGTDISSHGFLSVRQPPQGRFAFTRSPQSSHHQPLQAHAPTTQAAHRPRVILARPIIKAEALRKSYYDPKTVARDILVAAGRHPSERPLNAHYAGLLHRHIELDSDLSTFEWDAVDPGGPPMPQVQMADIPAGPPKWKLGAARRGRGHARVDEPIREQSAQDANPTPAIASLARLSDQTKNLLRDSQQAATAPSQNSSVPHQSPVVEDTFRDDIGASVTPQKRKASLERSPTRLRTRSHPSSSPREPKSVESEHNMQNSGGKRRGRPPGAKNKHPSLATMKKASNTTPLVSIPSRPRSPSPVRFDVYDCQWRKCNAKLHNLPTLRRHISKVHQPSPEEAIRWGHTCWWKKCRTLVRNEDKTVTPKERFESHSELMEHISQEHLHPLGMEKGDGPSTSHIGKHQLNLFDLNKYLYQPRDNVCEPPARIVSYTDPQSIAADRVTYLSDERGRIVAAPRTEATNDEYVPDALILAPVSNDAEERAPIKQYMRAHGNEKMDLRTSASEILRAMEVKKERVGPGMDRGGCTLVNNERRATLLQNEGISKVVVDDD